MAMKLCKIEGCDRPHRALGWCSRHWQRWRAHGDPLGGGVGRADWGEPLRYFREVVLTYDGTDCLPWPYARNSAGYARLVIDGRDTLVSRLVCEEIHGPPPTPAHEAAHNCGRGDHACVTKRHLDWRTKKQNEADKLLHGTRLIGAAHPLTKITDDEVREIRALANTPDRQIAKRFDISMSHVAGIQRREKRGDVI